MKLILFYIILLNFYIFNYKRELYTMQSKLAQLKQIIGDFNELNSEKDSDLEELNKTEVLKQQILEDKASSVLNIEDLEDQKM